MNKILLAISVLALSFATGFTCSKNTPAPAQQEEQSVPDMEEMGYPIDEEMPEPPPPEEVEQ